jgi:hypothetical protein
MNTASALLAVRCLSCATEPNRARLPRTIGTYACCANWTARKLGQPAAAYNRGPQPSARVAVEALLLKPCEPYVGHSTRDGDRAGISIRGS